VPHPSEHNYVKKLLCLIQEGKFPEVGLQMVEVYHDDWCAIHLGRCCNCDPDIDIRRLFFADPDRN
jgi:hypothetical protein